MANKRGGHQQLLAWDTGGTLGASLAVAALGFAVRRHWTRRLDRRAWWYWSGHSRPGRPVAKQVSRLLPPPVFFVIGAAAAHWLRRRNRPAASSAVLAGSVASLLADDLVKEAVPRMRPPRMWLAANAKRSFPSGHSTAASGVCGVLGYVLTREAVVSPACGVTLATVPPSIVGASRVYLGEHWATDVLAGWATGLAVAGAAAVWYEVRKKRSAARSI